MPSSAILCISSLRICTSKWVSCSAVTDVGIDIAKSQILEFGADLSHSQAMRNRRIDIQRLLSDLLLSIRGEMLERPHVVQTVGQLDKDHSDVVHHGQHHFAQIFGLLLLARVEINLAYLGDALDNVRHLLA